MIITVDSNILLSIFARDSLHNRASDVLYKYSSHEYVINDCIYLELGVHFQRLEVLGESLNILEVNLVKDDKKNYDDILKAWIQYLKKKRFQCPNCGKAIKPICPACHHIQLFRQRILADFTIAGFALVNGDGIITFDQSYYKNYFPRLKIFE